MHPLPRGASPPALPARLAAAAPRGRGFWGPQCLGTAEGEPQPGSNRRQPTSTGTACGAGGNGQPPLCCLRGKDESGLH